MAPNHFSELAHRKFDISINGPVEQRSRVTSHYASVSPMIHLKRGSLSDLKKKKKMLFGVYVFFCAAVPQVATGKNYLTTILPILSLDKTSILNTLVKLWLRPLSTIGPGQGIGSKMFRMGAF